MSIPHRSRGFKNTKPRTKSPGPARAVFVASVEMCELSRLSPGSELILRSTFVVRKICAISKRDDISAYALRISDCPVCHPASVILWPRLALGLRWCDVSKLSKTAQSRGRLSAPWLRRWIYSPRAAPSRAARMLGTDRRNPSLCLSLTVCCTRVIARSSADVSWGWRHMHGQSRTGARPSSAVVVRPPDVSSDRII